MSDLIVLLRLNQVAVSNKVPYCKISGPLNMYIFDMANFLTVWHMHKTRKHVEDPTRNMSNKVKMPLLISTLISVGHISMLEHDFTTSS